MMYCLGVDGGQSSTRAVIGDAHGAIVGRGVAGPCNHVSAAEGEAKLRRVISEVVDAACLDAGISADTRFAAACFGMSGGPDDKRRILGETVNAESIEVVTDAAVALAGAAAGGPGIVVIAGTGSIAYGKSEDGRTARAGGWGYIFGDEGGAFDIVRRALRKALAAGEGWGPETTLQATFLTATSSETVNEAMHKFYSDEWPRDRIAKLAPLVDEEAQAGDGAALQVLDECGHSLGVLAGKAPQGLAIDGSENLSTYPIGGVFESQSILAAFKAELLDQGLRAARPRHQPAVGALILAYGLLRIIVEIKETHEA